MKGIVACFSIYAANCRAKLCSRRFSAIYSCFIVCITAVAKISSFLPLHLLPPHAPAAHAVAHLHPSSPSNCLQLLVQALLITLPMLLSACLHEQSTARFHGGRGVSAPHTVEVAPRARQGPSRSCLPMVEQGALP